METVLAALSGTFVAGGIYLLLSRSLIRMLLGFVLLANSINLAILVAGRLTRETPPIVEQGLDAPLSTVANALPQALILTAIVIGFAMFAFLLVLAYRTYRVLDADDTDSMRVAEPKGGPQPPLSY